MNEIEVKIGVRYVTTSGKRKSECRIARSRTEKKQLAEQFQTYAYYMKQNPTIGRLVYFEIYVKQDIHCPYRKKEIIYL